MVSVYARWLAIALTSMLGCSQGMDGIVHDEGDASVDASPVEDDPQASAEARAVVSRLASALDALRAAQPPVDLAHAETAPTFAPPPSAARLVRAGAWLSVEVPDASKRIDLRLPVDAREPFHIADPQTGVAARVRLRGALSAQAEVVAPDVVYRKAAPGQGDLVHRPSASGTEDFVLYEQKPAEEKLSYEVEIDERVRGLRLVANTLELLDEHGAPRLRVNPPYVIGHDGQRYEAEISVRGCAVDTNPAAPWDRETVAPGASTCTVEVAWNDRGVSYPAVVDPSWVSTKDMSSARHSHVAELLPTGKVLVAGGYATSAMSTCELYDPTTDTWAATGSMSATRQGHGGVALTSGKVLVVGGQGTGGYLNSAEVYDPQTGTWSATSNAMSAPRHYGSVVLLADGRVLVVGGRNSASSFTSSADVYAPATNSFSSTGSLTYARYNAAAVRLADGRVLVVGGYGITNTATNASGYMNSVEIYNPSTGAFSVGPSFTTAREVHTATLLSSGKVLVFGGRTGSVAVVPPALLYEPTDDTWTTLSTPPQAYFHTATLLPNGKVLIAGGVQGTTTYLKTAMLFDPATNAFSNIEDLPASRAYHTATRLASGDVLLAGGFSGSVLKTTVRYRADSGCTDDADCPSGHCVGGRCCESACDGGCGRCDVAGFEGICRAVAAGSTGSPSCAPYVCNGTSTDCPTSCVYDVHCAPGHFCAGLQCYAKFPQGQACTANNQCQSGYCVDGYCCNGACAGGCDVCSVALGASANGVCTVLPSGTNCGDYVCNGVSGNCPSSCASDANCASDRYCNASGACVSKRDLGQSCTANNQCSSGFCVDGVCCNSACEGGCNRCNLSGSVGTCTNVPAGQSGQNPSCGLYACSGTSPNCPASCTSDAQCVGSATCTGGVCVGKLGLGESCNQNTECDSGHCVDGVCCNSACSGGGCDRCDLVGYVGTCRTVTAGGQGSPSCAPYVCNGTSTACPTSCTSDAQCVTGYACIGGVCKTKQPLGSACVTGNDCVSGHCADGVCCDSACTGPCERCDIGGSVGACRPAPDGTEAPACGAFLCNGVDGSCPTSCTGDEDCKGHCYAGTCHSKQPLGTPCLSGAACESGFCVDGTCCDSACDGQCARCDAPGSLGTCTAAKGAPIGDRPPCTSDGSACGGSCDGVNMDACSYPSAGLACGAQGCEEGAFVQRACDGQGRCEATSETCAPYACGESGCLTSCTSKADCSESAECVDGVCKGTLENGASCSTAGECASGFCVDGVCCQSSCTEACMACNVAGAEGVCVLDPSEAGCEAVGNDGPLWEGDDGGCGCRVVKGERQNGGGVAFAIGTAIVIAMRRRKR